MSLLKNYKGCINQEMPQNLVRRCVEQLRSYTPLDAIDKAYHEMSVIYWEDRLKEMENEHNKDE